MTNSELIQKYSVAVEHVPEESGGGYQAYFPKVARSLVGYGTTQAEAIEDLMSAVPAFLDVLKESDQSLPPLDEPKSWEEFSGKFNVRVPKLLHAKLVRLADEQGVSLNSMVQGILTSGATALEAGHEFGAVRQPDMISFAGPALRSM